MKKVLIVFMGTSILLSCSPSHFLNAEALPNDLKNQGKVLLVLEQDEGAFRERQNKGIEKLMKKKCDCEFEMVSTKDLSNPKYNDLEKYTYLVMKNAENTLTYTAPGSMRANGNFSSGPSHREYTDQVFIDRRSNKKLPSTGMQSESYAKGMSYLAKKISKQKSSKK